MIKLPATFTGYTSRKDRSASVRFETQELSKDDVMVLFEAQQVYGWLIFFPAEVQEIELPREQPEDKSKTPAKRLRAVLYKWFQQTSVPGSDFETFYRSKMEQIIDHYKGKLDL